MADVNHIGGILGVMRECSRKLPTEWQADFWLESAHDLARILVKQRHNLSELDQGVLVGIGGMMLRQASNENEASASTAALFQQLRDAGGGHD
jgi:hypothetical protein